MPTTLPRSSTSGPPLEPTAKSAVVVNIVFACPSARCTKYLDRMPSVSVYRPPSGWLRAWIRWPGLAPLTQASGGKASAPSSWQIARSANGLTASSFVTG